MALIPKVWHTLQKSTQLQYTVFKAATQKQQKNIKKRIIAEVKKPMLLTVSLAVYFNSLFICKF